MGGTQSKKPEVDPEAGGRNGQSSSRGVKPRHASGPTQGGQPATGSSGALRNTQSEAGSLKQSHSAILRRTGSTATTDKPFDLRSSRVSFGADGGDSSMGQRQQLPSGKSLTSVHTRTTVVSRTEYHEDLKQTISAGLNINLILATTIIVFGSSFLFGYNIGVLNQPQKLIQAFYNETYTERYGSVAPGTLDLTLALTTALFIPGGMIGSFLGGWLADNIGRKRTILFSHIFAFLGAGLSTACVAAKAPELLMIGRVLVGVNSGLGNCIAPMFLSEIAPYNYRGAFGTLHQLLVTGGIFFSSVFGLDAILGTKERWPYLILLEAIPALVSLIVLPFLPETPRYLLLVKHNRNEAVTALKFYRRTDNVENDMEEMDTENQAPAADAATAPKPYTLAQLFAAKDLRRPLFIACMLQIIQQFSGVNAIFFYSSSIFQNAQVAAEHIPYAVIGTNAVNVLMTVVAVPLMDLAGRRLLLLAPMGVMIVDFIVITICMILKVQRPDLAGVAYVTVACVIVYVIAFAAGLGPIPMMIGAELFRQAPRPKAMAVASVVNWIATFIIAMSFEAVAKATGEYVFVIFLILVILFVVFTYFFVPETKNKTIEEIANLFSPGPPIEVEEINYDDDDDALPAANDAAAGEHELVTLNFGGKKPAA